jgi:hypothetical protein
MGRRVLSARTVDRKLAVTVRTALSNTADARWVLSGCERGLSIVVITASAQRCSFTVSQLIRQRVTGTLPTKPGFPEAL